MSMGIERGSCVGWEEAAGRRWGLRDRVDEPVPRKRGGAGVGVNMISAG